MPPGFGLLDAMLIAVPVLLTMLGLIRGAPVELASCCGCMAGIAAAWAVSCLGPVQGMGQPAAPLLALAVGMVVWRLARGLSRRLGFDTRWIDLGRIFDSVVGGLMGAVRGLAIVSAACLAYAVVAVPFGLANPLQTVAYPVFLALGSQVTSAVITRAQPAAALFADTTAPDNAASVPLPFIVPHLGPPQAWANPAPPAAAGPSLAALAHAVAPAAVAAPLPAYRPDIPIRDIPVRDIPVRGIPVGLMETHHNILHPFGSAGRRHHR